MRDNLIPSYIEKLSEKLNIPVERFQLELDDMVMENGINPYRTYRIFPERTSLEDEMKFDCTKNEAIIFYEKYLTGGRAYLMLPESLVLCEKYLFADGQYPLPSKNIEFYHDLYLVEDIFSEALTTYNERCGTLDTK